MTIIDKIIKGDIAPKNTNVLWLNTLDNIIYVFSNGWIKTSTGAAASVYTGTEAERLAIEDPFNGLEFHQVDDNGKVTRYLYDLNAWTIVIDPADYIIRADQDHTRAEADHTTAASDHTNATQDHSLAVVDHQNAADDHAQYLVDHASIAYKANVDGYYGQMTVGAAENLVGDSEETYTFTTNMTGGEVEFGSGAGQLTKVQGNGLAWNQLVQNGDFANGTTGWRGVSSLDIAAQNGILTATLNTTPTANWQGSVYAPNGNIYIGHKYYIKAMAWLPKSSIISINISNISSTQMYIQFSLDGEKWSAIKTIVTANLSVTGDTFLGFLPQVYTASYAQGDSYKIKDIIMLDLTLLGIDNLTTTAEVEAWLADNIGTKPYYQYNAGELFGTKVLHLISYGQNLLNPTNGQARLAPYEYGNVNSDYGILARNGASISAVTFTPDATGVAEAISPDNTTGIFSISGKGAGTLNVTMTSGSLADVYVWAVYDGAKDGIDNYVPFAQDAVEIKVSEIYGKLNGTGEYEQVFADGVMRGAGDAHDTIDLQTMTADVNVGRVDMGSLSWETITQQGNLLFISRHQQVKSFGKCISPLYSYKSGFRSDIALYDKSIGITDASYRITVRDSAYSDPTVFTAAMNGVPLWYELATPLQYTDLKLSSDGGETFRDLPTSIVVDNWGVWQQKPSEGLTPVTGHDFEGISATISTILPMDAVEILKSVQDNGIMASDQRAQLNNILTALQTAGIIGSFTIAETPTDKAFPITVTAPVEPEPEP